MSQHGATSKGRQAAAEERGAATTGSFGGAGPGAAAALTERAEQWASTMAGHRADGGIRVAHADSAARCDGSSRLGPLGRAEREAVEAASLAPGATRAAGAGRRAVEEEADGWRTCFERDRDRILHSSAFRRLAGKTQVFVFPDDHQRTRLTHALEVAQVATAVARALRLNVALAEAIAVGHDCGHGPGGHASEDAFSSFLPFDHATWGADVTLAPLNLCAETLDGIRNHSWSRPAPRTPEGEVVSWADRIAYVCHDLEDAVAAGVVTYDMVPPLVVDRCGATRSSQLRALIKALVEGSAAAGRIGMAPDMAEALTALRSFDYEHVYLRPASVQQGSAVVRVLRALVELYADRPNVLPTFGDDVTPRGLVAGSGAALREAVAYVAGMTDRFAFSQAVLLLGWDPATLPVAAGAR